MDVYPTLHGRNRMDYCLAQLQLAAQVHLMHEHDVPQPQTPSPQPQALGEQEHPSIQGFVFVSSVFMVSPLRTDLLRRYC